MDFDTILDTAPTDEPIAINTEKAIVKAPKERRVRPKDPYAEKMYNQFIESLADDKEELKAALGYSDNTKAQQFLADLVNPKYEQWTVTSIATKNNITPTQVADIWRHYKTAKGMTRMFDGLEEVSQDIVGDARSTRQCCTRCDGDGWIKTAPTQNDKGEMVPGKQKTCPQCGGSGWTRVAGNADARKLMLETVGFTGKRSPLIQQTFNNITVESVMDDLERFDDSIINVTPVE